MDECYKLAKERRLPVGFIREEVVNSQTGIKVVFDVFVGNDLE